jgi:hypothetical protein
MLGVGRPPIPPGMQIPRGKFVADSLCFFCLIPYVMINSKINFTLKTGVSRKKGCLDNVRQLKYWSGQS